MKMDVLSAILQGCDYTLCFILVSHHINILFAAATWLLKHFKHHSKVTALKCKTLFSYIMMKHLLMKTRAPHREYSHPKEMSPCSPPDPGLVAGTDSSSPITFLMNCKKWVSKSQASTVNLDFAKFFRINYCFLVNKKKKSSGTHQRWGTAPAPYWTSSRNKPETTKAASFRSRCKQRCMNSAHIHAHL